MFKGCFGVLYQIFYIDIVPNSISMPGIPLNNEFKMLTVCLSYIFVIDFVPTRG